MVMFNAGSVTRAQLTAVRDVVYVQDKFPFNTGSVTTSASYGTHQ